MITIKTHEKLNALYKNNNDTVDYISFIAEYFIKRFMRVCPFFFIVIVLLKVFSLEKYYDYPEYTWSYDFGQFL